MGLVLLRSGGSGWWPAKEQKAMKIYEGIFKVLKLKMKEFHVENTCYSCQNTTAGESWVAFTYHMRIPTQCRCAAET